MNAPFETNEWLKFMKIHEAARASDDGQRCAIAPHPKVREKILVDLKRLMKEVEGNFLLANGLKYSELIRPGYNDGLIYPGITFALGTPARVAKSARLKAPLSGSLKVIVVMVEFPDKPITKSKKHIQELFFSEEKIPGGSVRDYFKDVTNGKVDIQGEVVGPYKLPKKLTYYTNNKSGLGLRAPNARTMAKAAAVKANPHVDFSKYDNDKDNYVDAFVIVHAGTGAETTNNPDDMWSHKWVFNEIYKADNETKVYSYLTVPEDCSLGVCAHELGHLLFGFPDLYDENEGKSNGVGDWCLMGTGSWCDDGNTPCHPSAWCKYTQNWVDTIIPTSNQNNVALDDVGKDRKIYKLWKDGNAENEFFLIENRQLHGFDAFLPGSGLLIWHIDESIEDNNHPEHYRVALMQADGKKHLENGTNSGDGSDPFPGLLKKKSFTTATKPGSKSYAGINSKVQVKNIRVSKGIVKASITVK